MAVVRELIVTVFSVVAAAIGFFLRLVAFIVAAWSSFCLAAVAC